MPFSKILSQLLENVSGSVGAGFVAEDGETVQVVGALEDYAHRVHLAYQRIFLDRVGKFSTFDPPQLLICVYERFSWIIYPLDQGYCLVLTLKERPKGFQALPHLKKAAISINADL
jgi:hypothetical protein